MVTEKLKNLF